MGVSTAKQREQLFAHEPSARYVDYYERALFNHILSTQHPEHGGFVYFTPIRPRHYRVYSQPSQTFWCCVGSGLENHTKYGRFIYAHGGGDGDGGGDLFVNLFIASTLEKIAAARRLIDASGRDIRLEVDGGIKVDNIGRIAKAGADTFVAVSAIFASSDYRATIDAMRREIAGAAK